MNTSMLAIARAAHSWTAARALISIAAGAVAVGAYLVLISPALTDSFTAGPHDTAPAAQFVSATATDARIDASIAPTENSGVLTLAVDGPNVSVDFYCDPISDDVPPYRVHVSPEEMMDTFHRLCRPLPDS
jgi:hypothetical protein